MAIRGLRQMRQKRMQRYRNDPVAFVHDCFIWGPGQGPVSYQDELLAALPERKRVSGRGPHGLGKTALAAWAILWFALTRDALGEDWKVPVTASAWRQLAKYLFPELHKWARRLRWNRLGREPFDDRTELQSLSLKLGHGEAFAVASNRPELIEGAHGDSILYVFDESKAIPAATFDAAEGALSGAGGGEAFALAVSTPGPPSGRFYDIQARRRGYEDWHVLAVGKDRLIAEGRMDPAWAAQRARQWGEKSAVYQNRVEGDFAASDEDSVIPLSWVEAAIERWHELHDDLDGWKDPLGPLTAVSLDVSDGGEDRSFMARRHGLVVPPLEDVTQSDPHATMALAGLVWGAVEAPRAQAIVDSIGVGAGIVSRLRELGARVVPFNASAATPRKDASGELGFLNARASAWWGLRERLHPETGDQLALPDDEELIGDLTTPKWTTTSAGKIQVQSKDEIRALLSRSTDRGDAVVMLFWVPDEDPDDANAFLRGAGTQSVFTAMAPTRAPLR